MLEEAISKIQELADLKRRPDILDVKDGTDRPWLLDAAANVYEPKECFPSLILNVSNIDSFCDMVLGIGGPDDGSIVVVTKGGGLYLPFGGVPDRSTGRRYDLKYLRSYSVAWTKFYGALGQPMEQVTFVRLLQALRLNIADYGPLVMAFRKVSFDERTEIISNPFLDSDGAKRSLSFELRAKTTGADYGTSLPAGFSITVPVTKDSYTLDVEIDVVLSPQKKPLFSIHAPDADRVLEEVRKAEVATLKTRAAEKGWAGLILLND